jgi:toxin ParE1/3/4
VEYELLRTDKFNDQLQEFVLYIADVDCVDVALKQLDLIESFVIKLKDYPKLGSVPRYQILKNQGYRALIIPGYLIFYKIFEEESKIVLFSIFSDKQNYVNLI